MRKLSILAAAALSLAVADVASAQTTPVPLSFDNAVLNTPATPNAVLVSPSTTPITATADVDLTTGAFTIDPANLHFPSRSFTSPAPGSIQVSLGAPATGQLIPATGQVALTADFTAQITITGVGGCAIDTGSQTYSTENSTVYPGKRFPTGPTGVATGPGAITGGWATLPDGTGPGCTLLNSLVKGPGGLWISNGVAPPAPAKVSLSSTPAKKTVAAGKSVGFTAKVKNTGGLRSSIVTVCVATPKKLSVIGKKCKSVGGLAAGASSTAKFKVKAAKTAKGSYKVQFSATGKGLTKATASSTLKVKAVKV